MTETLATGQKTNFSEKTRELSEKLGALREGRLFIPIPTALDCKAFFTGELAKNLAFLKKYGDDATNGNARLADSIARIENGSATYADYANAVVGLAYLYSTLVSSIESIPEQPRQKLFRAFELAEKTQARDALLGQGMDAGLSRAVPKKIFGWGVDSDFNGNQAGRIIRVEPKLNIGPVAVGLGGGMIAFDYFSPQPYLITSAELDASFFRNRWNAYSRSVFAYIPETKSTATQYMHAHNAGTSIDAAKGNKYAFRVGADIIARISNSESKLDQLSACTSFGASFLYYPFAAYAIGRFQIGHQTPINQGITDLRLFPASLTAGITVDSGKYIKAGGEFEHSRFEKTGRLSFSLKFIPLEPVISAAYTRTSGIFGNGNIASFAVTMPIGSGRANAGQETDGNGGSGRLTSEYHKFMLGIDEYAARQKGIESSAYAALMHSLQSVIDHYGIEGAVISRNAAGLIKKYMNNEIRAEELFCMLFNYPEEHSVAGATVYSHGRNAQVLESMIIEEIVGTHAIASSLAILDDPEHAMLQGCNPNEKFEYLVYRNISTSNSLEEFGSRYSDSSFEDKIRVAALLAKSASKYYDHKMAGMGPFSGFGSLGEITPNEAFLRLKSNLIDGTSLSEGICPSINGFAAEFLRQAGIDAYAIGMGTGKGAHLVAAASDPAGRRAYIVDSGQVYSTQGNGIWPVIEQYAKSNGVNLMGIDVYGEKNSYLGYYRGPEGRLMDSALGIDDLLKKSLLRKAEE